MKDAAMMQSMNAVASYTSDRFRNSICECDFVVDYYLCQAFGKADVAMNALCAFGIVDAKCRPLVDRFSWIPE
jgi:hypothetical protein